MRYFWIIVGVISVSGCAAPSAYNPMSSQVRQELRLNNSGFKAVQDGMSLDQVHQAMGSSLTIGYEYHPPDYKPLTIPNPYKSEVIKNTDYVIEYYIASIRQPDNIVSDNELMPLIFKGGKLVGRGWPMVDSLHKSAS